MEVAGHLRDEVVDQLRVGQDHPRVVEGRRPVRFLEAKWGDQEVDRGLRYLKAKFPGVDAWQVHATGTKDHVTPEGIRVAPAAARLSELV